MVKLLNDKDNGDYLANFSQQIKSELHQLPENFAFDLDGIS